MVTVSSQRSTGLTEALAERFADGTWHRMDEAVVGCGHLIAPQIAVRALQRSRGTAGRTLAEQVEAGRRRVIANHLRSIGAEPGGPTQRDLWSRFRLSPGQYGVLKGEHHPCARLDAERVREIRRRAVESTVSVRGLAAELGVCKSTIQRVIKREIWKHVE